jgi:tRNA uridine 5-carbamoylmethylation protein Kti12
VQRALSRATDCVIADGCSLAKGFRYELHILARNAGTPSCCLWVGPDVPLGAALEALSAGRAWVEVSL